ncbi:MAG: OmpA family protein [Cypionkella sp.]|nr:OmpA family protein [Cypionkella sp.]
MTKKAKIYLPSLRLAAVMAPLAFVGAGLLFLIVAFGLSLVIERVSANAVTSRLLTEGITWADVEADGLQVRLIGTAPNEAARYRLANLVATIVDASRLRDELELTPIKAIEAPRFSLEILRNDDGIQMIGLLPVGETEARLIDRGAVLAEGGPFSEMIETANYPASPEWETALDFGLRAFEMLPRSKISISQDRVLVTAIATSIGEKRTFDTDLARSKPNNLNAIIEISAPRPVITPFTLRFVKDASGARFDACAADTDAARDAILAAAEAAGASEGAICTIGLGVPSPRWQAASVAGIAAVGKLASGAVTLKDADVTLIAGPDVSQRDFDRIVGDLSAALPDVFSLAATLEQPEIAAEAGAVEFTANLVQETGRVELRGRLPDEMQRGVVENFAKATFGADKVYQAAVLDAALPTGWPVRVLAGIEALGELDGGDLSVQADTVTLSGVTGNSDARARVAQILSGKLGAGAAFKVDVKYDRALDPIASLPTPQECEARVQAVLKGNKIVFAPASTEIDGNAAKIMGLLATALDKCSNLRMEIAGHTDNDGSDASNLSLSQARADAVLIALQGRQVDVSGFVAKGYGETAPIADNATAEGRDKNRRIAFTLMTAEAKAQAATATSDAATAPSLAPKEITLRPKPRPARQ